MIGLSDIGRRRFGQLGLLEMWLLPNEVAVPRAYIDTGVGVVENQRSWSMG